MAKPKEQTKQDFIDMMRRFGRGRYPFCTLPDNLTSAEAHAIIGIHRAQAEGEEAIHPRNIAKQAYMTPSALSQIVKALEEKGLIERHRMSDDYRSVSLTLTEEGQAAAHEAQRLRDECLLELIAYVGQDDIDHLTRTLGRVMDFQDRHEGGRAAPPQEAPRAASAPPAHKHRLSDRKTL